MKKRARATKLEDHICPTGYRAERRSCQPHTDDLYADSVPLKTRKISYIPGEHPLDEPQEIPRLFIRGLIGGSIKIDLRGLGVALSEAAFAHWVADESLEELGIRRGDLALIDPFRDSLQEGNLILLELEGRPVARLLTKKRDVWYAEAVNQANLDPVPLWAHPFQGVVLGIVRLFTKVKATSYCGTDANFKVSHERSVSHRTSPPRRPTADPIQLDAPSRKPKHDKFILAGKNRTPSPATVRVKKLS